MAENVRWGLAMKCRMRPLAALLLAIALAAATLSSSPPASADEYSDATLEAFASAAIEVSKRIEAWRRLIETTPDAEEREGLVEDAQADLARAIEETEGIHEDEYYAIYEAAREDEALRKRIDEILSTRLQRPQAPRAE